MIDMYKKHKKADRVLFDLPIDYLSFVRFFALEQIVSQVSLTQDPDMVSYANAYLIFRRMGLIAFNQDIGPWTMDLT